LVQSSSATVPLISRDISLKGLRTEPNSDLPIGTRVGIVLYGKVGAPVAVVNAEVMRDDGDDGLVFAFKDVTKEQQRRLASLIKGLPTLDSDPNSAQRQPGVVIAEIARSK
jgi:hypothetical protein